MSSIEIREKPDPMNYIDDSSNTQIYNPDVKFEDEIEKDETTMTPEVDLEDNLFETS